MLCLIAVLSDRQFVGNVLRHDTDTGYILIVHVFLSLTVLGYEQ